MVTPAAAHASLPESLLLAALSDGVLVRNADGQITTANAAARALLGADLTAAGVLPAAPCEQEPFRLRRPGRPPAWLSITAQALPGGGELVVIADRTAQHRLEGLTSSQHAVTRIMTESTSVTAAGAALVEALGNLLSAELEVPWHAGALWLVEDSALSCVARWDPTGTSHLAALSVGLQMAHGEGLPGRVWAAGGPVWLDDLQRQGTPQRRSAFAADGLLTGLGFPVTAEGRTIGVLELFSRDQVGAVELDDVVPRLGEQLGEWIRRRRAEEHLFETARELEQRNDDLERSNAELEQFAYVASHDLSEPLRMVSSYVQLLQRRYGGQLGPDADEYIGFAVDGALRMRALIDDLLVYSRCGRAERGTASVNLDGIVAGTLRSLAAAIAEKDARVEADGPLPTVVGDPTMLGQLFQNLVANALKFTAGAAPHVRVECRRLEHGWEFAVRDNGIGIDPEHSERIFKMFQRLHRRDQFEGTGIGLAVCRKIVEQHGGRIWVEPAGAGGGSVFRFTIGDSAAGSPP